MSTEIRYYIDDALAFYASHAPEIVLLNGLCLLLLVACADRRRAWAAALAIFVLLCTMFLTNMFDVARGLGVDSLQELTRISSQEAIFYLWDTLFIRLNYLRSLTLVAVSAVMPSGIFLLALIVGRAGFRGWIATRQRQFRVVGHVCVFGSLLYALATVIPLVVARVESQEAIRDNFAFDESLLNLQTLSSRSGSDALKVVVYVGESTSAMHFSLYGYWRDTTPRLAALAQGEQFFVYRGVHSTHSHTYPSLLEALSMPVKEGVNIQPVEEQRRLSVIDVLEATGIPVHWISRQGKTGSWNLATYLLTTGASSREFQDDSLAGNVRANDAHEAKDLEYFAPRLRALLTLPGRRAIFLHSYAGHGPYLDNIPEDFRNPVDGRLRLLSLEAYGGHEFRATGRKLVERYDSAMTYIDHTVSTLQSTLEDTEDPAVFIYLSDHGESPWSRRGHDSSRYIHEMTLVPLTVFVNKSFQRLYPEQVVKLHQVSQMPGPITLRRLSPTLLALFGRRQAFSPPSLMDVAAAADLSIMKRRLASGLSSRQLQLPVPPPARRCYHRANTVAKAIRGASSLGCVEVDVIVDVEHAALRIYHPPAPDVGLELIHLGAILLGYTPALWLDIKNLNDAATCKVVLETLSAAPLREAFGSVLVEFPPSAQFDEHQRRCAFALMSAGIRTSYYISTDHGLSCIADSSSCADLRRRVEEIAAFTEISDVSYDFRLQPLVDAWNLPERVRLNTWDAPGDWPPAGDGRFGFVMTPNRDPNHL